MNPVTAYVNDLRNMYGSGQATEHSYRSTLESLLRAFDESVQVINEPRHLDFGAPDLVLQLAGQPIGYVECKDVRVALDAVENSEQLIRYRKACDNLILTNYREFRWYRGGDPDRQAVTIARLTPGGLRAQRGQYGRLSALLERFQRASPADITSPEDLARVMADLTREIADLISETLNTPNLRSFLHKHKHDLEVELLPELDNGEFADMYAQTLAYALFAARMELQHLPARDFTLARAFADMPRTNRFLHREFGQIFQELEREVKWAVEQLTTRLANTQISEVMRDFRSGTRQRDAIVHFYEDFLATHDPVLREQRGVYFTPEPVVGYIVRSVDSILRSRFNRSDGLASSDVHILDPATGTGSFLLAVVEQIYETMRGQRGIWPDYVRRQLLPRLHGFELLMAPYTLAHMRLGLFLDSTDCHIGEDERLNILLTNALVPGRKIQSELWENHIVAEANAAAEVKNDKPIMVVLGNPPYSVNSANKGDWITELLSVYRVVDGKPLGERKTTLSDDYVKFIRFGQWRIEQNGEGVLAFITNHAWLDNVTFRGMRQSLLNSFSEIYVLDLHGNSKKLETTPDGGKDQNVFDIQQGVSIALFVKHRNRSGPARVYHADLWGLRREKFDALNASDASNTNWLEIEPDSPHYFFRQSSREHEEEYNSYWDIREIFGEFTSGIQTSRDNLALGFTEQELEDRVQELRGDDISDEDLLVKFKLKEPKHWNMSDARRALRKIDDWKSLMKPCLYRPFDDRFIVFSSAIVHRTREKVMRHMFGNSEFDFHKETGYERQHDSQGAARRGAAASSETLASSRSDKWRKGPSTTSSQVRIPSTTESLSATRGSDSSSRSTSTQGRESGHDDITRPGAGAGLGSGHLHTGHSDPSLAVRQGSKLRPAALPLQRCANLALCVGRAGQVIDAGEWNIVLCTDTIADFNLFRRGGQVIFPLYLYGGAPTF